MKSISGAFDRLGGQTDELKTISENTASVALGGDMYERIDTLTTTVTVFV